MAHYICTGGCGGEKSSPGVCETEDCAKKGQPMSECHCSDGSHEEVNPSLDGSSENKG